MFLLRWIPDAPLDDRGYYVKTLGWIVLIGAGSLVAMSIGLRLLMVSSWLALAVALGLAQIAVVALMDNELGLHGVVKTTIEVLFATVEFGIVGVFATRGPGHR